jgi:hypothetical protein
LMMAWPVSLPCGGLVSLCAMMLPVSPRRTKTAKSFDPLEGYTLTCADRIMSVQIVS